MAAAAKSLSAIGHAALLLAALEDGIRVQERLAAAARRSSPEVDAESAKLEKLSARLETKLMPDILSEEPLYAFCREISRLLKDATSQIAVLATESQTKRSMLDRLKLSNKPSKSDLNGMRAIKTQMEEQLVKLDELVHLSLEQEAKDEIRTLSSSPNIDKDILTSLQSVSTFIQELAPQVESLIAKRQQTAALSALGFGKLHERFDSITVAEANTYAWLLPGASSADGFTNGSAPAVSDHLAQAKKTFLDWLETGSGFFYTSGKPGAGKSTLMKFICRHSQFYDCANRWAGDATLVIGRFFFWKPGQSEQKNIEGMLRGLLYSVLEAQPDIAAVAMPELCANLLTDNTAAVSHEDVKNAFQNMLQVFSTSKKYALMLVLDGLDEFEGEHGDLLALMQSWVSQYPPTIKICVSSREYGIFEDFFSKSPKFRLHELTKDDMALLIESRFGTSKAFDKLPGRDLDAIRPLMTAWRRAT
ncbi:hypothetical protein NLG97_g2740 [Lecanicillium saksenae]|uniref:Uncharacterized protein n=1 Tax=Lecanicillium saksenae TaxID=468837 RepID=A0ACC1R3C4_9HYPO|nr:hypothetical protein NLG97_g2740 [Lecanicillium saksenae]